mgnify:CR=1 FL=1
MNERQWAESVQGFVSNHFERYTPALAMRQGANLPYANEIRLYRDHVTPEPVAVSYETDLLVAETVEPGTWTPRVVVECKLESITTHDAITYSEKAFSHKKVHPYLRYGILLGKREHYPLPGRLFRHGLFFDFMLSWTAETPTGRELDDFLEIVLDEVDASRNLEAMLYNSRRADRKRYVVLHKPLRLR